MSLKEAVLQVAQDMEERCREDDEDQRKAGVKHPAFSVREVFGFVRTLRAVCQAAQEPQAMFPPVFGPEPAQATMAGALSAEAQHRHMIEREKARIREQKERAGLTEQLEAPRVQFVDGPLAGEFAPLDMGAELNCRVPVGDNVYVLVVRDGVRCLVYSESESEKWRGRNGSNRQTIIQP